MTKPVRLGLGVVALLLVASALALAIDWQFWSRYLTKPGSPSDLSVEWYKPQSAVQGDYLVLARNENADAGKFSAALSIAKEYNTRALLVAIGDTIVLEHYAPGIDAQTPHLTFSFHKTITALLVGAAISDNYITGPHTVLGDIISEWDGDPRGAPSLESAMQMAAGYQHPNFEGSIFSSAAQFYYGSDIEKATLSLPMSNTAMGSFDYGDRSAQIVGLALQRVIPSNYEEYLSSRLWKRLRARDASVVLSRGNGPAVTYCCLMATAEDWVKVGMLLRDGGIYGGDQIIDTRWIEQMVTPSASNPNFGLFLWLGSPFQTQRSYTPSSPATVSAADPFAVDDVVFMDGAGGQRVYVSRSLDLVVIRLGEYRSDWDDTRLFNAVASELDQET